MNSNICGKNWTALTQGWFKANWDVALDKSCGMMGIGVVVREVKGRVIAAMSKFRRGTLEATTREALAGGLSCGKFL